MSEEKREVVENDANDKKETKAKAKASKKDDKLVKENEQLKTELQETKDLLLRTAAEFDNYKKRETAAKEKLSSFVKGETLKAILPSLDNIQRALSADENSEGYAAGVSMTIKGMISELNKLGLEEINPVGENIVTEVLQVGYKLGDNCLRPAMVKVANCD